MANNNGFKVKKFRWVVVYGVFISLLTPVLFGIILYFNIIKEPDQIAKTIVIYVPTLFGFWLLERLFCLRLVLFPVSKNKKMIKHSDKGKHNEELTRWSTITFWIPIVGCWKYRKLLAKVYYESQITPEYINLNPNSSDNDVISGEAQGPIVKQFNSIDDKIARLQELKDNKLISNDEYNQLLKDIVNKG